VGRRAHATTPPPAAASFELVADDDGLRDVVVALRAQPAYALDTEFHREKTYFPRLALVQIAWEGDLVLIDPVGLDLTPLAEVLKGDAMAVLHAADQDLEVLDLACGAIPERLFDTQIAAGFLGMATPSLAAVYERELGLRLPKADRLTDWLRRPLTPDQLQYAASDVAYLLDVYARLSAQLTGRGRRQWALDECEQLRRRQRGNRDPEEAWRRIKEARSLRGQARSVAQAVAAWRERRAAELDLPVRYVMPDLAVVSIAQRPPKSVRQLRDIRGLDDRHLKQDVAGRLIEVIAAASERRLTGPDEAPPPELDRELRPAVTLVSAWISQLARDLEIDTALLATRSDLEMLLRGAADARLAVGWRAEIVGEPIRKLVSGEAALAFGGHGHLVLEERSRLPLATSWMAAPPAAPEPAAGPTAPAEVAGPAEAEDPGDPLDPLDELDDVVPEEDPVADA
jgi:ribonuclease D